MRKYLSAFIIGFVLILGMGTAYAATLVVPQGGTGRATLPLNMLLTGNGKNGLTSTSSPTVGYISATNTSATSSMPNLNIAGTLQLGAQYITNFTTSVLAQISAGTGISILGGQISFSAPSNSALSIPYASTTQVSASGGFDASATSSFKGITNYGWEVGTTTTVCPDGQPVGCRYYGGAGLVQAVNVDHQNHVRLKTGAYTIPGPILPSTNGFTLVGEGDTSVIQYNGTGIKVAIMSGNPSVELSGMVFENFRVNETGAGGRSVCMDISRIVTTLVSHVHCDKHLIGFMASTGQSYYNKLDTDDVTRLTSTAGVNPLTSVGFYFGDNGSGDGGPIDTTIINSHVTQVAAGSSTSYYFNAHSTKCLSCNSEGGYAGMTLGPNASDSNLNVYLEANKINLTMAASLAEVGGVNISGNISDASPLSGNIIDNGVAALCVNARVQYAGVNYCTNVKQGFGTNAPKSILEVSDRDEAQTPGLHTATAGLFGSNGPAIALTRGGLSDRFLVNPSLSGSTNAALDFVLATSTYAGNENSGVRFSLANAIGTNDILIQGEVQNDGYAIFEGYSSTTISGSTAGTAISSRNSPVLLAPNRSPLVYATENATVGIATSTPAAAFAVQGNQFIAGNIISTSTTASKFPNASSTAFSATTICFTGDTCRTTWPTGVAYPFTSITNFGTTTSATTSSIWTQGVFLSSSTVAASQFPYASTTAVSANNLCLNGTCITSFAGSGASTTLLADSNTWTGKNFFSRTDGQQLFVQDTSSATNQKNWLFSNMGGSLYIGTTTDAFATSTPPAMTILNNGRVGFGASNPLPQVEVVTNADTDSLQIRRNSSTAGTEARLGFRNINSDATSNSSYISSVRTNTPVSGDTSLVFANEKAGAAANESMRIATNGNLGIATTTPNWTLTVASSGGPQVGLSAGAGIAQWVMRNEGGWLALSTTTVSGIGTSTADAMEIDPNGNWYMPTIQSCNGTTNALGTTAGKILCDSLVSDQRLKKDIMPLTSLDTVMKLSPVTFFWKDTTNHNTQSPLMQYGFTAQSVQPIFPSAVGTSPDGYLTLDKTALIAPIVSAIQEIEKQIQSILARLDGNDRKFEAQQKQIDHLQAEIDALK